MTTKKDLVEAHAFSRRRLVTAFLSGAPGGREVEPSRPGRTILGGIALAVLVVAGGAVAHELKPRAQSGWDQRGLVVTDRGSRYVVTKDKDKLRPVVNLTSAQLILGLDPKATVISQSTVDKRTPGGTIGILGAPESLPETDDFITTGWTACTADAKGVVVDLATRPTVTSGAGTGVLVTARHQTWLISESSTPSGATQAYRYLLPSGASALEQQIFTGSSSPSIMRVSQDWLNLFPEGTPLSGQAFPYNGYGGSTQLDGKSGVPAGVKAGDIATAGTKQYLVLPDGWVPLTDFEAAVYRNTPHEGGQPDSVNFDSLPPLQSKTALPENHWPAGKPRLGPATACAQLHAGTGEDATVRLVSASTGSSAWPEEAPAATQRPTVSVTPGKGSFFYAGSGTSTAGAQAFIVDSRGTANLLEGPNTLKSLGLDSYKAAVVPDTWVKLFGTGTPLSTDLALCPPGTTNAKAGKCAQSSGE